MLKSNFTQGASALVLATAFAGAALAGDINGQVVGSADGASLPGAVIRIVETGAQTASDRSGQYRFTNLPAGEYTIEVEYLGYQAARRTVSVGQDGVVSAMVGLSQLGAETADTIVVQGTRLGFNRALNEQRTNANISNVVSADLIGSFPDNNVAESVSRLPGITLVRDQQTGEGAFVTIRGLDSRLNVYTVNGVRIASSDDENRAINLSQITADGLSSVSVSKTLLPSMEGDAIGGTVDFRTPSAFDYGGRSGTISATTNYNDRAEETNYEIAGSFSTFLIEDRLGLYASFSYEDRFNLGQESENEGDWLPFHRPAGRDDLTVDPQSFMMQGVGLDLFETDIERWGGNFTLDYRWNDGSQIYLRGSMSEFTKTQNHHYVDVQNDDEEPTLVQVDASRRDLIQPNAAVTGYDPVLGRIYSYTPGDIVDTDGDGIITDADRTDPPVDDDGFYTLGGQSGIWAPQRMFFERGADFKEETQSLISLSVGGEHFRNQWTFDWDMSYSYGEFDRPYDYDFDFNRFDRNAYPFTEAGVTFSFPQSEYPQWQLTPAQQAALYDANTFGFNNANGDQLNSTDENIILQANARRDFSNFDRLNYVQFGANRRYKKHEVDENHLFRASERDFTLADQMQFVRSSTYGSFLSGFYEGEDDFGFTFDRQAALNAIRSCDSAIFNSCSGFEEELAPDTVSEETVTAGYVMASAQFGDKLEVIGGVRVEHTEVENEFYSFQSFDAVLADSTPYQDDYIDTVTQGSTDSSYTNWLPSLHFNYRHSDRLVARGAIWTSIARPSFEDITARESISGEVEVDATGNFLRYREDTISISRGNPGLEPAESVNFDLGFEYYSPNGGLVSANVFYKDITNFIFSDFASSGDVPTEFEGLQLSYGTTRNGGDAEIYGFELAAVQQFTALPAPFDGFGVAGNFTYQQSNADPGDDWRPDVDFINAPETQYNAQIFYERDGLDARLAYQYTDRFIEDLRNYGVNKWIHDWDRLDFQMRYTFDMGLTVRGEVQNILDGHNYWAIRGEKGDTFQKDYVENGRTFYLGVDYRF